MGFSYVNTDTDSQIGFILPSALSFIESQDHLGGEDLEDHQVQPFLQHCQVQHQPMSPSATSTPL